MKLKTILFIPVIVLLFIISQSSSWGIPGVAHAAEEITVEENQEIEYELEELETDHDDEACVANPYSGKEEKEAARSGLLVVKSDCLNKAGKLMTQIDLLEMPATQIMVLRDDGVFDIRKVKQDGKHAGFWKSKRKYFSAEQTLLFLNNDEIIGEASYDANGEVIQAAPNDAVLSTMDVFDNGIGGFDVEWSMLSEQNVTHFLVERAFFGTQNFVQIGSTIAPLGAGSLYFTSDFSIGFMMDYTYRLTVVFDDGSTVVLGSRDVSSM